MQETTTSRRTFLKRTGVTGAAVASSMVAGCSGFGGGSDDETVNLTSFPGHTDGVIHEYIDREGILDQNMEDAGYEYTMESPQEDIPLFLSGEADQVNMGTLEAARVALQEDVDLAVCGRINSIFYSSWVRTDSDLDVDNSGGPQESWNIVAEEDRPVGIITWGLGNIPGEQVLLSLEYDLDFREGGGDIGNVVTADGAVIPQLILDGDLDVGMFAPSFADPEPSYNEDIEPLYILVDQMVELGYGIPHLDGPVFHQSFVEEHEAAVTAYLDALDEAMAWFYEDGVDEIPGDEGYRDRLNAPSEELAAYQVRWLTAWDSGEDVPNAPENATMYETPYLPDGWIEENRRYVNTAGEIGQIGEGWSEDLWGDQIEYVQF